jgi:hypothetical protein
VRDAILPAPIMLCPESLEAFRFDGTIGAFSLKDESASRLQSTVVGAPHEAALIAGSPAAFALRRVLVLWDLVPPSDSLTSASCTAAP